MSIHQTKIKPSCPYCGFEIEYFKLPGSTAKLGRYTWGCEVCNYRCRNTYRAQELAEQAASLRTAPRGHSWNEVNRAP